MTYEPCDYPIGVNEIATVLSVKPSTVSQWGVRKNLPDCDAIVNGGNTKLWTLETILNWASSTGRNNNETETTVNRRIASSRHRHDVGKPENEMASAKFTLGQTVRRVEQLPREHGARCCIQKDKCTEI